MATMHDDVDPMIHSIDKLFGDRPALPLRESAMFAQVVCSNDHEVYVKAAVYDPETGMSVWGSQVDDCIECEQMNPPVLDSEVKVLRYFVAYETAVTDRPS